MFVGLSLKRHVAEFVRFSMANTKKCINHQSLAKNNRRLNLIVNYRRAAVVSTKFIMKKWRRVFLCSWWWASTGYFIIRVSKHVVSTCGCSSEKLHTLCSNHLAEVRSLFRLLPFTNQKLLVTENGHTNYNPVYQGYSYFHKTIFNYLIVNKF